ncbi:hypothetical protein LLG95_17500 [bacterium]|nr:hypothetical protein [bacterium]
MAKNPKPTHDQLQRDEIADSFHETLEMIHANRRMILMVVVALILLAIAVRTYAVHSENVKTQINSDLAMRMNQYEQVLLMQDQKARSDAANALVQELDRFIANYGTGSKVARGAIFLRGMTQFANDQYKKSQADYTLFLKDARDNEERARGEIALAYSIENQSFLPTSGTLTQRQLLDEAVKHYEAAEKIADNQYPYLYYYALMGQARYNELINNNKKAIELYGKILKDRPQPTPEPTQAQAEDETDAQRRIIDSLRQVVNEREAQLSLAATAKLRLERLQANAGLAPVTVTAESTATTPAAR